MFSFRLLRPPTINLADSDQRELCLRFIVPASNGGRQSTARQTFEPECLIVFWFRDQGPNDNQFAGRRSKEVLFVVHCSGIERRMAINCATDFQAGVFDCVCPPSVSRTNHSQASASQRNRRQAVAGYGIELGHRVERAEDLRLIAVWS